MGSDRGESSLVLRALQGGSSTATPTPPPLATPTPTAPPSVEGVMPVPPSRQPGRGLLGDAIGAIGSAIGGMLGPTSPASASAPPMAYGLPPTPAVASVPDWSTWLQNLATEAYNTPDEEDDLLLGSLFEGIPLGAGFWSRLAGGTLTDEDRELAMPVLGSGLDDTMRDKVLKKLIRGYGDYAAERSSLATGGFSGSGSTVTDPSYYNVPGDPNAVEEAAASQRSTMETRLREDTQGTILDNGEIDMWREREGKIYARYDSSAKRWRPTGDLADPDIRQYIKETAGTYSLEDVEPILRDENPAITAQRKMARAQIQEEWEHDYAGIRLQTARLDLSMKEAKDRVDKALERVTVRKAQVDLEAAEMDLLLKPIAQRTAQMSLEKMKLEYDQSQAKFPLELESLQLQIEEAREQRLERERKRTREQANDRFSREVYPSLIAAIAPNTSGATPPPVYDQLAQRAGVTPDDPNAQLAFAAMQQSLGGAAL